MARNRKDSYRRYLEGLATIVGNVVSAIATANDIFGKEGVIASYKACFSGGH
jgi:hypothetical protein